MSGQEENLGSHGEELNENVNSVCLCCKKIMLGNILKIKLSMG